jgi:hypothetical protein
MLKRPLQALKLQGLQLVLAGALDRVQGHGMAHRSTPAVKVHSLTDR